MIVPSLHKTPAIEIVDGRPQYKAYITLRDHDSLGYVTTTITKSLTDVIDTIIDDTRMHALLWERLAAYEQRKAES